MYGTATCPDAASTVPPDTGPPVFVYLAYDVFLARPEELDVVLALLADRDLTDRLEPVVEVLQTLGREADIRRALVALVTTLLRPDVAEGVLADLSTLLATGAFEELVAVVDAVVRSCPEDDGADAGPPGTAR
jgi:hypothetical protein